MIFIIESVISRSMHECCCWGILHLTTLGSRIFHIGHRGLLRWWRAPLLVLSVSVLRISSKGAKSNLCVSSLGSVVESPNLINKMRFKGIEAIVNLKLTLDTESLPMK